MPKFVPSCSRRLTVLADGLVGGRPHDALVTLKGIMPMDLRMLVGGMTDIVVNWEGIAEIVLIEDIESVGQAVVNCMRIVVALEPSRRSPRCAPHCDHSSRTVMRSSPCSSGRVRCDCATLLTDCSGSASSLRRAKIHFNSRAKRRPAR
jgi:hypothetical protein